MMISRRKILEMAVVAPFAAALPGDDRVKVQRRWEGPVCHSRIVNQGTKPVRIKEVLLFELSLSFAATTRLYGEGFQMLSQTGGTLGQPAALGNYTDAKHYKLPDAFYGMMTLSPSPREHHLYAFTSCQRFIGQFYLNYPKLQIVVDTENLELRPGETWQLEPYIYLTGNNRERLLDELASHLTKNHPRLRFPAPPAGWCSWYCFGPRVWR